ncbi:hypothetical protein Tco_0740890 [Tanacetum coccineum]
MAVKQPSKRPCLAVIQRNKRTLKGCQTSQTHPLAEKLIADLPMLIAPKEREELIMYLVTAKEAISAVLITEREGKQMPVPRISIKGQILADFIVERPKEESLDELMAELEELPKP